MPKRFYLYKKDFERAKARWLRRIAGEEVDSDQEEAEYHEERRRNIKHRPNCLLQTYEVSSITTSVYVVIWKRLGSVQDDPTRHKWCGCKKDEVDPDQCTSGDHKCYPPGEFDYSKLLFMSCLGTPFRIGSFDRCL